MITVVMKYTDTTHNQLKGFSVSGHAGFARRGKDIVCAGVSILTFNCMESIESLTDAKVSQEIDHKSGSIDFTVDSGMDDKVNLLLLSLLHGLEILQETYSKKFIDIIS